MKFAGDNQHKLVIIPAQRVAGNMNGREDAIRALRCISEAALGCEREISEAEYYQWDTETKAEYAQSGWCLACQNKIFADPEDKCSCEFIDVGLEVLMPNPNNDMCPEHGDPDMMMDGPAFNYDPDMREDDPPTDINEIKWMVNYAA